MSWKLFWQIVLLIVIAAVIGSSLKCGLLNYRFGSRGKYFKDRPQMMQKEMMQKGMMQRGQQK